MKLIYILALGLIMTSSAFSQYKMNMFFRQNLYEEKTKAEFKLNKNFGEYFIITPGYFESNKGDDIDLKLLEKTLNNWFPDLSSDSYLIIDWERKFFKDLKKYDIDQKEFIKAQNEFIKLINYIKKARPKLKVSIYGIPFRYNYSFQRVAKNNKFDELLKYCDFITPSLYISFSEPSNHKKNIDFLKNNLTDALLIANRLNKNVIPFVWYKYNGANEKLSGKYIDKDSMKKILQYIDNFSYNGLKVYGVMWWDTSKINFEDDFKAKNSRLTKTISKRDEIIKYYEIIN